MQTGWEQSRAPNLIHVPYGSGNTDFGGNDFGNYRPATITGIKYHDLNGNGAQDIDEPGLEGWLISLSNGARHTTGRRRHVPVRRPAPQRHALYRFRNPAGRLPTDRAGPCRRNAHRDAAQRTGRWDRLRSATSAWAPRR